MMLNKLAKLVDVKSIVTLVLTGVFSFLAVTNRITGEQFLTIFTTVIAFYFGTQAAKNSTTTVEPVEPPPESVNAIGFSIGEEDGHE